MLIEDLSIIIYRNTLCCPNCNHTQSEDMPALDKTRFYQCEDCNEIVKARESDCCVYCSYGEVKCPPTQAQLN